MKDLDMSSRSCARSVAVHALYVCNGDVELAARYLTDPRCMCVARFVADSPTWPYSHTCILACILGGTPVAQRWTSGHLRTMP